MDYTAAFDWRSHYVEHCNNAIPLPQHFREGPRRTGGLPADECDWVEFPEARRFKAYHDQMPLGNFARLPPCATVKYEGWMDEKGRDFFKDVKSGEVSWHLPCAGSKPRADDQVSARPSPGMAVLLRGTGIPYLEGSRALILQMLADSRALVTLPGVWRELVVKVDVSRSAV